MNSQINARNSVYGRGVIYKERWEQQAHVPWLWCVTHLPSHSSSRLCALITRAFPATASLSCFHLATTTAPWEERGRGKRVRKRNKKREKDLGLEKSAWWRNLERTDMLSGRDESTRNKGCVAHLLKWWHDSNKESTFLPPAWNHSHERATQQSRTAKFSIFCQICIKASEDNCLTQNCNKKYFKILL